jgi:hypothetical protein
MFIIVETVEPFGGWSEVIRVFFVPVISVFNGGSSELPQSKGEVDMKRECGFIFGPVIESVVIIEVDIFIQTSMIIPSLARVRITITTAQVLRDRRSAAASVVMVIFEGSQRGRIKLGAIETIKVERSGISALLQRIVGSERGWEEGVNMLSILGYIAVVKVWGVGNKVECGVILEVSTCIQQGTGMLPRLLESLTTRLTRRATVEGTIVLGQRALRAEPATASTVAAI